MHLVIGEKTSHQNPRNCVNIECLLYHGDADLYTNATLGGEFDPNTLKNKLGIHITLYIEFFNSLNELEYQEYSDLEKINEFKDLGLSESWPCDQIYGDGDFPAHLSLYKIYYFDYNGVQFNAKVE